MVDQTYNLRLEGQAMEWISVEERLPESANNAVLVWDKDGYFEVAEYWGGDMQKWVTCSEYRTIKGVTHWAEVKGPGTEA